MQDNLTEKLIEEIKTELKSKYPDFRGIYLFGSRARGDFHEDSDYDFVLIFEREINRKFKDEVRRKIIDYEIENLIIIDSHVYNMNDIVKPITPFRENVQKEGIYYVA